MNTWYGHHLSGNHLARCARACTYAVIAGVACVAVQSAAAQNLSLGQKSAVIGRPVLTIPVPYGMQDVAYDAQHEQLFVQYVHKINDQEYAGVQRYDVSRRNAPRLLDSIVENTQLGHQGLSLEQTSHGLRLWGSAAENQGKYAIRFGYEPNQLPAAVEQYKLFGDEFVDRNVTMPQVCSQGESIVARGRKGSRNQVIRIFDLKKLVNSAGRDGSNSFFAEWTIDPDMFRDGLPLQGVACDDTQRLVYLVAGKSNVEADKRLYVYNFEGRLLQKYENLSIGIEEAFAENGSYEPEGMTFFSHGNSRPALVLSVVTGRGKNKLMRLWRIEE